MNRKRQRLERLEQEISAKVRDAWLYPERGKVQGFLGAGRIMFVGERPATGVFPSEQDLFLYKLLERYRIADSHLTDVIKARGRTTDPYPDMKMHKAFLDLEVDVVRPEMIIAFGQKTHDLLRFAMAGSGIKITQVWHYSYLRRRPGEKTTFARELRNAISELK